jgi:predicted enzyme related to lactoylglutathione lyase
MRVKRIGWAGTRTSEYPAMVAFLQAVLGLTTSQEGSDFAAFQLPEGGTFEVFGPRDQDHAHFSTGPVVGFVVDDLPAAVRELEAAGVELLGGQVDERGGGWRHFRALPVFPWVVGGRVCLCLVGLVASAGGGREEEGDGGSGPQ